MTLLIFKTAERVFATTAWTAEAWIEPSGENLIKIIFLGEHEPGSPQQRVYFMMSMTKFLGEMVHGVIDLREWRHDTVPDQIVQLLHNIDQKIDDMREGK